MGNTKRKTGGREAPWPFRPTSPREPSGGPPSVWEAHGRDMADHKAMYKELQGARNRSDSMRRMMLDGYRARKVDLPELQRLANLGREWERLFPDITPGQLARLINLLRATDGKAPVPETVPINKTAIKHALEGKVPGDMLDGELS